MKNVFVFAKIRTLYEDQPAYTMEEDFPFKGTFTLEEIKKEIISIVAKYNSELRAWESPREFVELVGWKPMFKEENGHYQKRPDYDHPIISFSHI